MALECGFGAGLWANGYGPVGPLSGQWTPRGDKFSHENSIDPRGDREGARPHNTFRERTFRGALLFAHGKPTEVLRARLSRGALWSWSGTRVPSA